jgi:hypothetical protein
MPLATAPAVEIVTETEIETPSREDVLNLLSPDQFRAWLLRFPESHVVGFGQAPVACPVRNYLFAEGVPTPAVASRTVDWPTADADARTCGRWQTLNVPEWFGRFIAKVDRRFPYRPVTAGACLEILGAIDA